MVISLKLLLNGAKRIKLTGKRWMIGARHASIVVNGVWYGTVHLLSSDWTAAYMVIIITTAGAYRGRSTISSSYLCFPTFNHIWLISEESRDSLKIHCYTFQSLDAGWRGDQSLMCTASVSFLRLHFVHLCRLWSVHLCGIHHLEYLPTSFGGEFSR